MESDRRKIEEAYLKAVDIGYSYHLAKKMEGFKSNPVLGYRTAGSKAEFDTGEFLKEEMERIGLSDIHKDELVLRTGMERNMNSSSVPIRRSL